MINLLPESNKDTLKNIGRIHTINRLVIMLLFLLGCIAAVYISGLILLGGQSGILEKSVSNQQQTLAVLDPVVSRADRVEEKVETAKQILESEILFSRLIQEIGSVLPEGTRLNGLELSEDLATPMRIDVVTDRYTEALAAVVRENIDQSELFNGADIQSVNLGSTGESGSAIINVVATLNEKNAKKQEDNTVQPASEAEPSPSETPSPTEAPDRDTGDRTSNQDLPDTVPSPSEQLNPADDDQSLEENEDPELEISP